MATGSFAPFVTYLSFVPRSLAGLHAGLRACALSVALLPAQAAAQDSAFLACERFGDRGQRIACLEDALEAATAKEEAPAAAPAVPAQPQQPAVSVPATAPQAPAAVASDRGEEHAAGSDDEGPSLLERLRNFGRDESTATLSTDEDGQERLHDTIASLEKRREAWIVTLASGQVWMQDYPRALALREGDSVTIYRAGFGNGYRLETGRLSGFIRVKRVR